MLSRPLEMRRGSRCHLGCRDTGGAPARRALARAAQQPSVPPGDDLLPTWPPQLRARAPAAPPPPRDAAKTPRVSPRAKYGLKRRGAVVERLREPAPRVVRPQRLSAEQFYLAVAQGQWPPAGSSANSSDSSGGEGPAAAVESGAAATAAAASPRRRPLLFDVQPAAAAAGEQQVEPGTAPEPCAAPEAGAAGGATATQLQQPPPSLRTGTPALRHKICPGFTHARHWTTIRNKSLRKWLPLLDDVTAVVALRRLAALAPPAARGALEAAPVVCAGEVVAQAAAAAAAAAAAQESPAAAGAGGGSAPGLVEAAVSAAAGSTAAAAAGPVTPADLAAVSRGFDSAAHERAQFDLMVAALCAALAPKLGGFGGSGLLGVARRLGTLGVRHDGFWQAWCARADALLAVGELPLDGLHSALRAKGQLRFAPPAAWLERAHSHTCQQLRALSPAQTARLALAFGSLAPPPGDGWWAAAAAVVSGGGSAQAAMAPPPPDERTAVAAGRLLLGAARAAAYAQDGAAGAGLSAAAAWGRDTLLAAAAEGVLPPAAAVYGAAACAATRGTALISGQQQANAADGGSGWQAVWACCLERLQACEWQLSDLHMGMLCEALAAGSGSGSSSGGGGEQQIRQPAAPAAGDYLQKQQWPLPPGWLAAFEAATLLRLPALPPWLLLALLHAFAARGHAPAERWLGAALLLLQPWAGQMAGRQLAGLAADLQAVASGGRGAAALPPSCLAVLAQQAVARAAASIGLGSSSGGGSKGEAAALREAAAAFASLQQQAAGGDS